jgi:2-keto-3-deoxy-L-rhamnonate aldolase RhmA
MIENPVKRNLANGGVALGSFMVDFATPGIPRILAAAGNEFVIFDQEHTAWPVEMLKPLLFGSRASGVVPIVRVPATERFLIASVLDAGAMGVVVPWVESAEQARTIVEFAKFPPDGKRGVGPFHADEMDGDLVSTMATMNREQLLIAMVETVAGIENVDEIAAVDGIDMLWLGHGDLTTSLGIPGQFENPLFLDAVERIFAAAEANGKPVGILGGSADDARKHVARGFRAIGFADRALYQQALSGAIAAGRE